MFYSDYPVRHSVLYEILASGKRSSCSHAHQGNGIRERQLHSKNYLFRERKNLIGNEREVTLKFRHPDRYISQDRNIKSKLNGKGKIKFEEDIKAAFVKLYSLSNSIVVPAKTKLTKLKDVTSTFPGLDKSSNKTAGTKPLQVVNGLEVKEIVITGANLRLGSDPEVNAECALIIWYDLKKDKTNPLIGEFSFRYGSKKEKYKKETAQNAYDLFLLIPEKMKDWIDATGSTKTGFVYNT